MDKRELLKEKIEVLRGQLNQVIQDGLPDEIIYEKSISLDRLIEQYLDIVEQNQ